MTQPLVFLIVTGAPGTGKTRLAHALAERYRMTFVSTDLISDHLFPGDRESETYLRLREATYESAYAFSRANLGFANSVVLEAPFSRHLPDAVWGQRMAAIAAEAGARLAILRCVCDAAVLRARIAARAKPEDRAKLADWQAHLREHPIHCATATPHVVVDTGQPLPAAIAAVARDCRLG